MMRTISRGWLPFARVLVSTLALVGLSTACGTNTPGLLDDGRRIGDIDAATEIDARPQLPDAAVAHADASLNPVIDGSIMQATDAAADDASASSIDARFSSIDGSVAVPDAGISATDAHTSALDAATIDAPQIDAAAPTPDAAIVIDAAISTADAGLTPATVGRGSPGFAFDSSRNRIVMFAGNIAGGGISDATTEWNGSAWTDVSPQPNPSPSLRSDINGMVYDTAMAKCFLFGGAPNGVGSQYLGDTWTWDGTTWTQLTLTPSPPARNTYGLAYDSTRQVIVLFGGVAVGARANDTWEFNGTSWSQKSPAHSPSTRNALAMVYDSTHQRTLMFGGYTAAGGPNNELWSWDGTDWTKLTSVHSPPADFFPTMADDPINDDVIMFGGANGASTWRWDGSDWTQLSPTFLPAGAGGMTYDSSLQRIVLFGPPTATSNTDNTYTWEGTNWVQR